MPASKPQALHTRHATKAEQAERSENEASWRGNGLPARVPNRLHNHAAASAAWRRLAKELAGLQAVIVTRLDVDLLIDYCMLTEQVQELDEMRRVAHQAWVILAAREEEIRSESVTKEERASIAEHVVDGFDAIIKLDGRVDRKRALLLQMRQSLYLTPRSRAGVAPEKKEPEREQDEMESILSETPKFANGDSGDAE